MPPLHTRQARPRAAQPPVPATPTAANATPEPVRPEPARAESVRAEPVRSQSVRSQSVRSQSVRPEPTEILRLRGVATLAAIGVALPFVLAGPLLVRFVDSAPGALLSRPPLLLLALSAVALVVGERLDLLNRRHGAGPD